MSIGQPLEVVASGPFVTGNLAFPAALFLAGGPVVLVGGAAAVIALGLVGLSAVVMLIP